MEKRGALSRSRKAQTKRAGSEGASMPPGTCWSVALSAAAAEMPVNLVMTGHMHADE
jgi:hypothetical protein